MRTFGECYKNASILHKYNSNKHFGICWYDYISSHQAASPTQSFIISFNSIPPSVFIHCISIFHIVTWLSTHANFCTFVWFSVLRFILKIGYRTLIKAYVTGRQEELLPLFCVKLIAYHGLWLSLRIAALSVANPVDILQLVEKLINEPQCMKSRWYSAVCIVWLLD